MRLGFKTFIIAIALFPTMLSASEYKLGTGDVVEIKVEGEESLSGKFRLSSEGIIVYPLLGSVTLSEMTIPAATEAVRAGLEKDYIVSPQVALYVSEYASKRVTIIGDAPKTGIFILDKDSTLISLLAKAEVKLSRSDVRVVISHSDTNRPDANIEPVIMTLEEILDPVSDKHDICLGNGDRIFVNYGGSERVIITGKVKSPGVLPLTKGMTVIEALNKAGGVAEYGTLKGVRVIRKTDDGTESFKLNLSDIEKGDTSGDMLLKPNDIVVVRRRWL